MVAIITPAAVTLTQFRFFYDTRQGDEEIVGEKFSGSWRRPDDLLHLGDHLIGLAVLLFVMNAAKGEDWGGAWIYVIFSKNTRFCFTLNYYYSIFFVETKIDPYGSRSHMIQMHHSPNIKFIKKKKRISFTKYFN